MTLQLNVLTKNKTKPMLLIGRNKYFKRKQISCPILENEK